MVGDDGVSRSGHRQSFERRVIQSTPRIEWSFRDPTGRVAIVEGRVYLAVNEAAAATALRFIDGDFYRRRAAAGDFPATERVADAPAALRAAVDSEHMCVLEHARITFPVYPHEWTPTMVYDAGRLTLDLAESALAEGWSLKDATPWNVLYSDGRPVFCHVLSFEPRTPSGIWLAYAQFQRTFVLPLYAHKRLAWPVHGIFLARRDGIEPSDLESAVRGLRRWAPFELQTIIAPAKLSRGAAALQRAPAAASKAGEPNRELADFVLRRSLRRLRRQLDAVKPRAAAASRWSGYENDLGHYSDTDRELKIDFVHRALTHTRPDRVLDVGTNSGAYALVAASLGASVVAADFDVASLERLYERVRGERLPVTPVVLDIARPTPGVGWNNREVLPFLHRARGRFGMVMLLAVLHHLIVSERIPVERIVELLFDLDTPFVLVEWVSPGDERFREIARTHGELYAHLSTEFFEERLSARFDVLERLPLAGGRRRVLFLCERRR
jgi:SAM-dependent methyltransferase